MTYVEVTSDVRQRYEAQITTNFSIFDIDKKKRQTSQTGKEKITI